VNVYVLFHADLEDDRDVRGVYATREAAEAALTVHEVYESGGRPGFHQHHEWCCSVHEWPLLDAPEPVYLGPEYRGIPTPPSALEQAMLDIIWKNLNSPNIYRDMIVTNTAR
jgi:hypothetical protein